MSTIRAVIVDDEERVRNVLQTMVEKYTPDITVVGSADSVEAAYSLILKEKPNLIFLDVEMPYNNGFDLLKKLPKPDFEVIFVTGFDHYALKAIKFHALDYLLKPIDIQELKKAVQKVKETLAKSLNAERMTQLLNNLDNPKSDTQKITIPNAHGREFILVENIICCSADGSCTWFYLADNRKILSTINLGEYEKLLPNAYSGYANGFYRIHHGHLINLRYIQIVNRRESYVQMKDNQKISIAARRKAAFLDLLKDLNLF